MGGKIECLNGDILIEYDNAIRRGKNKDELDFESFARNRADHVLVLGRLESNDGRHFLHSAIPAASDTGRGKISGVRASQDDAIGEGKNVLVFRINDEELRRNFILVTTAYARRGSEFWSKMREVDKMKHQAHVGHNTLFLPTPYYQASFVRGDAGRQDPEGSNAAHLALFRNIRAYLRFNEKDADGNPMPLSKNWGLECSQFVSYSYMVASIMTIFPNGLPENITTLMKHLTFSKENRSNENLEKLYSAFSEALSKVNATEKMDLLTTDVKHSELYKFCTDNVMGPKALGMDYPDYVPQSEQNKKFSITLMGTLVKPEHGSGETLKINTLAYANANRIRQDEPKRNNPNSNPN